MVCTAGNRLAVVLVATTTITVMKWPHPLAGSV